ncbi:Zinc-regulated transporter 1 [Pleurostoma richardsiae]|uniref:Zinc-regulated transporter 1 n=1 Tax=Pleurostoma richardsiae TaxID=41990 RepID=A0AA38VG87_9PEZI|nr:Zinc-regulated transporter 1 [Pleurostoma richardsiae]
MARSQYMTTRNQAFLVFFSFCTQLGTAWSAQSVHLRRQVTQTIATPTTALEAGVTAVSECHLHGTVQFCMVGTTEFRISGTATTTTGLPSSYTSCHNHGTQTWCIASTGDEVQLLPESKSGSGDSASAIGTSSEPTTTGITAVSECHMHGSSVFCIAGTAEYNVQTTVTATTDVPPEFTGCHSHGSNTYCLDPTGDDVEVTLSTNDASEDTEEPSEENCHFHAGVEHCVGGGSDAEESETRCARMNRDYNISLRVGLLFVILTTSAIGVFSPIFLALFVPAQNFTFSLLKQFGTGVIISTAFVHLQTHANLMFENDCLGELAFEGTAAAVMMAGILLSFLVEYTGNRLLLWHYQKKAGSIEAGRQPELPPSTRTNKIMVLETGIIFHSMIIGVTLVVAGDSFFLTLFAVIVFHQMFEGIALGTRIAALGTNDAEIPVSQIHRNSSYGLSASTPGTDGDLSTSGPVARAEKNVPSNISMRKKLLLAAAFALVTPVGMAIGIGVIYNFNGNDPATIVAIGTLDAFSAGILVWVGVVEMLAHDWMLGGEMTSAKPLKTVLGIVSLVAGMALMSFLGKWA